METRPAAPSPAPSASKGNARTEVGAGFAPAAAVAAAAPEAHAAVCRQTLQPLLTAKSDLKKLVELEQLLAGDCCSTLPAEAGAGRGRCEAHCPSGPEHTLHRSLTTLTAGCCCRCDFCYWWTARSPGSCFRGRAA